MSNLQNSNSASCIDDKSRARVVNEEYYNVIRLGMIEYWNKMAAPLYRSKVIISQLKKYNVKSVLDLGCGCGQLLSRINSQIKNLRLAGMDLAPAQIEMGKKTFSSMDWFVGDLEEPDTIPNELLNKFDAVISSELIEHLQDPACIFSCASKVLKPNGVLIISTQGGKVYQTEKNIGHIRHFTKESLKKLFQENGYYDVKVWASGWPFHGISKMIANINPDATMKKFSVKKYGAFENFACFATRLAYRFNLSFAGTQLFAVGKRSSR